MFASRYTYDEVGRLLTVTEDSSLVEEYRYDNNGNRTYEMNVPRGIAGRTLTYSDEDHFLTAGAIRYKFDYDDNLTTRIDGTETTKYVYSSTGELMSVTLPDATVISYVNDPQARRIAKKINGTITEKYLWSGLTTLLAVYDGNNNLLQRFEYADGRMPYAMTSGGSTYYLTYNQVGSLKLVADSTGNIIKRIDYDSFGNIISDSNEAFAIPFGFAGGLHDRDTGLARFGYRDYLPEIGKWTAKDPILFAGGDSNLFGYVANDPVNFIDPDGLNPVMLFIRLNAPRAMAALQAVSDAWGGSAPSGKLAVVKEFGPTVTGALLQSNQTLGQCIVDSADYLSNQALHDLINGAIPATLDAVAGEFNKATTASPSPPRPTPSWTKGPLK